MIKETIENKLPIEPTFDHDFFVEELTYENITSAVMLPSGHCHDRKTITNWIDKSKTNPHTRAELSVEDLREHKTLQKLIEDGFRIGDGIVPNGLKDILVAEDKKIVNIITDPVFAGDGHAYHGPSLKAYFRRNQEYFKKNNCYISPRTGKEMSGKIIVDFRMKNLIQEFLTKNKKLAEDVSKMTADEAMAKAISCAAFRGVSADEDVVNAELANRQVTDYINAKRALDRADTMYEVAYRDAKKENNEKDMQLALENKIRVLFWYGILMYRHSLLMNAPGETAAIQNVLQTDFVARAIAYFNSALAMMPELKSVSDPKRFDDEFQELFRYVQTSLPQYQNKKIFTGKRAKERDLKIHFPGELDSVDIANLQAICESFSEIIGKKRSSEETVCLILEKSKEKTLLLFDYDGTLVSLKPIDKKYPPLCDAQLTKTIFELHLNNPRIVLGVLSRGNVSGEITKLFETIGLRVGDIKKIKIYGSEELAKLCSEENKAQQPQSTGLLPVQAKAKYVKAYGLLDICKSDPTITTIVHINDSMQELVELEKYAPYKCRFISIPVLLSIDFKAVTTDHLTHVTHAFRFPDKSQPLPFNISLIWSHAYVEHFEREYDKLTRIYKNERESAFTAERNYESRSNIICLAYVALVQETLRQFQVTEKLALETLTSQIPEKSSHRVTPERFEQLFSAVDKTSVSRALVAEAQKIIDELHNTQIYTWENLGLLGYLDIKLADFLKLNNSDRLFGLLNAVKKIIIAKEELKLIPEIEEATSKELEVKIKAYAEARQKFVIDIETTILPFFERHPKLSDLERKLLKDNLGFYKESDNQDTGPVAIANKLKGKNDRNNVLIEAFINVFEAEGGYLQEHRKRSVTPEELRNLFLFNVMKGAYELATKEFLTDLEKNKSKSWFSSLFRSPTLPELPELKPDNWFEVISTYLKSVKGKLDKEAFAAELIRQCKRLFNLKETVVVGKPETVDAFINELSDLGNKKQPVSSLTLRKESNEK